MNYAAALTDFFKSPKWMMNLLLGALCCMIPVVGPLVFMGWLITGFWGREDERPETFPDFDFNQFTKYLERGVWPFVVALVVSMVVMIPVFIVVFVCMFGMVAAQGHGHENEPPVFMGVGLVLMFGIIMVVMLVMHLVMVPLMLRACRTQDFKASFSFAWAKDFIARMWLDVLLSMIILWLVSMVLGVIGYLMICIGMFAVMPLIYFAWFHLKWQLYKVYLGRGGQPVPLSPKLQEGTPPPIQPSAV